MEKGNLCKGSLVFLILVILSIFIYYSFFYMRPAQFKERVYADFGYPEEREILYSFVEDHFLEEGWMRTNLLDAPQDQLASGEDILSESVGLLMLYYLEEGSLQLFERQVAIIEEYFINQNQLIQWRVRFGLPSNAVNAPVDDLRIIKALIKASEQWNREDFLLLAKDLSAGLLRHVVKDNRLLAYDSQNSPQAPFVYYDFEALQLMAQFHEGWHTIVRENADRIAHHKLEGRPFFRDRWFYNGREFPMIENLMILMHFAEVGVLFGETILWLKEELEHNGLFGRYGRVGEPLNSVESPSIYALVAIIAKLYEDENLYHQAIHRLRGMQILDCETYYGGFVNTQTLSAYSFDQLLSLLAY